MGVPKPRSLAKGDAVRLREGVYPEKVRDWTVFQVQGNGRVVLYHKGHGYLDVNRSYVYTGKKEKPRRRNIVPFLDPT